MIASNSIDVFIGCIMAHKISQMTIVAFGVITDTGNVSVYITFEINHKIDGGGRGELLILEASLTTQFCTKNALFLS